jgi:hypothetical protein
VTSEHALSMLAQMSVAAVKAAYASHEDEHCYECIMYSLNVLVNSMPDFNWNAVLEANPEEIPYETTKTIRTWYTGGAGDSLFVDCYDPVSIDL